MKTLYAVTFHPEEPEYLCIADSEHEARDLTIDHAKDYEIPITGQFLIESQETHPDLNDFQSRYTLRNNPHDSMAGLGGKIFGSNGIEWDTVRESPPGTIWTLIESDGIWWICPGIHFVDRLGYLLTEQERVEDERHYLCE